LDYGYSLVQFGLPQFAQRGDGWSMLMLLHGAKRAAALMQINR
jgi:hypothetical protein